MRAYVKVKCVSLADEAKLICRYERQRLEGAAKAREQGKTERAKYHFENYWGMRQHRIHDIRKEARIANITYGFMLGHPYSAIERNSYTQPNWTRVKGLVMLYGEGDKEELEKRYDKWEAEALAGEKRIPEGGFHNPPYGAVSYGGTQPRSIRFLTSWVLRFFQGNWTAWNKWFQEIHPKRVKKPYVKVDKIS